MKTEDLVARADALIAKGLDVLSTHQPNPPNVIGFPTLDSGAFSEWQSQSLTFLTNAVGPNHVYTKNFEANVDGGHTGLVKAGIGILRAIHEDLSGGYLFDIRTLVAADVFSDFIEMAEHLLESGYKDSAASLTGAVREDGLRNIALRNNIKLKAREDLGSLNMKCADAALYSRLVQKKVSLWTGIRNHADHGEFGQYSAGDVREMLSGVTDFLATYLT
jgi:hypothetical protein